MAPPTAKIRTDYSTTTWAGPYTGFPVDQASRDDLRAGYYIKCTSIDTAIATYTWSLAFTPDSVGPAFASGNNFTGTPSTAALVAVDGTTPDTTSQTVYFKVDFDGAYLLCLVMDVGTGNETTQYVRVRSKTRFGNLKLPSAGERRDALGIIPVDVDATGWTDDLNQNLLRLTAFVRRNAASGRVLYVDANRGRDSSQTPNDPTNIIRFPGPDATFPNETGIRSTAEGFGDFATISEAINYALAGTRPNDPVPSSAAPYFIVVKPGFYNESIGFMPFVYVISAENPSGDFGSSGGVVIRAMPGFTHTYVGGATDYTLLVGLRLENDGSVNEATLTHVGGILDMDHCTVIQNRVGGLSVSALTIDGTAADAESNLTNCYITTLATDVGSFTISTVGSGTAFLNLDHCFVDGQLASAIQVSLDDSPDHQVTLDNCHVSTGKGPIPSGYGMSGQPSTLHIRGCLIEKAGAPGALESLLLGSYAASTPNNITIEIYDTSIRYGDISVDPTGVVASKVLTLSNVDMQGGAIVFPALPAAPTIGSYTLAKSLGYDPAWIKPETNTLAVPVPDQLASNTVQDAIDELTNLVAGGGGGGGPIVYNHVSKVFADSGYTLGATDYIVGWDTSGGPVTLNLPAVGACTDGRTIVVKDEGGVAGANTISIGFGAGTFLETGASPINVNGGSVTLYYNSAATKWFMV